MATSKVIPPLPPGFVLEERSIPPLPPGFVMQEPEAVQVDDLFEDQQPSNSFKNIIYESVKQQENSVAKNNPYGVNLPRKKENIDLITRSGGRVMQGSDSLLEFDSLKSGMKIGEGIIDNILKVSDNNPAKFYSNYSGLPENSPEVKSFVSIVKQRSSKKQPEIDTSQPSMRAAPELNFSQKFKNAVRNFLFEDKTYTNVKGQMIYQISKDTGKSLREVEKDYDDLIRDPKITGIRPEPTTMEMIETGMIGGLAAGAVSNPVMAIYGTGLFLALDEAENAVISGYRDGKYQFGAGRNISEFAPEDATRRSKETLEIISLIGKGFLVGMATPGAKAGFRKASEFVTKRFVEEYSLPKEIYIDARKVRSIFRQGKKDRFSPEERDLLLEAGLNSAQRKKALDQGATIRIPTYKITKMVDKPWFAKLKKVVGKPKSEVVVSNEPIYTQRELELGFEPRLLLREGKPVAAPKVQPPPEKPAQPPVEKPAQPPVEKPLVSTGNYQTLKAPKYVTDFLMNRVSSMTINDGGSIGHANSKTTNTMLSKLIKQGFVEGKLEGGYSLTEKGKQAKDQVAQNEKLAKEGVSMDHYSQKKVTKDPLMREMDVIVGKMDGKPAYSNGHYLIQGKPAPETVISPQTPEFDNVVPESSASDPIAKPIGWYQSDVGKLVVLSDGTKHSAVDSKYYDFVKTKFPNSDFRVTTQGELRKSASSKEPIDTRFNMVTIYSGGKRVGVLVPFRNEKLPSVVDNLIKPAPTTPLPTKTAAKKSSLNETQQKELSALKESLNNTISQMSDGSKTSNQLLRLQNSVIRLSKLIQDLEPGFKAPEFPFESELNKVEASSLRQANIEASERNQHFGDTKAAKDRVADVERISRADIVQFMRNAFGVTIRGKATHRMKGVAGFFRPDKKTVRSKVTDDVYVLAHEVAHFIDNKIWGRQLSQRPHFRPWQEELGKLDYDQKKQRTSEGFAEFVRHFVSTGQAKKLAPSFYEYFTGEFARENKEIYDNILKLRELMTRYNKQGSVERVKSQINFDGKPPKQPIGETIKDKKLALKKMFLDDIAFLPEIYKEYGIKGIKPSKDPLKLMRIFKGKARSKAEMAVRYNTTDYVGNITGKGLVDVIKPVSKNKQEIEDFMAYAYARRALSRPDIDAGIELSDAQFVFDKFDSKKFRKASDELSDWAGRILDYYVDSRAMSPETKEIIREMNPVYLPLYRFFSNQPRYKGKVSSGVSGGKPVKSLKGSGRQILNPIESMIRYVENMYSSADKVRVALALRDLSNKNILPGGLIEKVPPPINASTFKTKELDKKLEKTGFGIFKIFEDEPGTIPDLITMFTSSKNYSGKDNIIPIYEGNEVSFYELDPRLYDMIKGLDQYQLDPVTDFFFGKPTRMLKLGAVGLNAGFSYITNPFRDLVTYMIYSKSKFPNPAAPMVGLAAELGIGSKASLDAARRFKAMGGDMATIMGRDRARYKRMVADILNQAQGGIIGNSKNVTLHPINTLRRILEVPELAPRIAEMMNRIKYYEKIYGKESPSAYIEAMRQAQDVTINFSKLGTVSRVLNQLIPFFNPILQGGEKLYRETKDNPLRTVVRGTAFITPAALYFWNQNKDKDWFNNLSPEQKYSHIYIDSKEWGGSGEVYSLPLPHELGTLFGGLPMAYADQEYETNKEGLKDVASLAIDQLNPVDYPAFFKPFSLVLSNKKWYGAPIETMGMKRKEIPDRYTDYTLPMAKVLSRFLYDNVGAYEYTSPVMIETFLNTATGGLAKSINDVVAFSSKDIESKADLPVVGKLFLRKEVYENRPTLDFERLRLLEQKKVSKTITGEERLELSKLKREYKQYRLGRERRDLQKRLEQYKQ